MQLFSLQREINCEENANIFSLVFFFFFFFFHTYGKLLQFLKRKTSFCNT